MVNNYKLNFSLLTLMMFATCVGIAQIPNPGFENWHSQGFPSYNEPDNWGTLNSSTAIIGVYTVEKATGAANIHSGTAAMKLSTHYIAFASATAPGMAVTGTINTNNQSVNGGFPFSTRPTLLTGWYKGTPASGDTSQVEVYLFKNNGTSQVTVADGIFRSGATVSSYTRFIITLNYHTNDVPDTGRILLFSSNPNNPIEPSVLYIDDLAFVDCAGFSASVNANDATHVGWTDGDATATPTGGSAPYNYLWNNTATTSTISSIGAGNYCVTVTDNNGCTVSACDVVNDPPCNNFSVSVSTVNVTTQGGTDGSATANLTGGSGPYSYNWSNSATTAVISNLSAGNYCVTATDNVGCTSTACGIVSSPSCAGFSTSVTVVDATTVGGSDGTASAINTGGTGPFTYLWSNGATTSSINNLVAASYCVTVTDASACIASACGTVGQPSCAGFSLATSATDETTVGGNNGSVTATPSGGATPYSYLWNTSSSTQTISNLAPGSFCVTVTDNVGCVLSTCDTVNAPNCAGFGVSLTVTDATGAISTDGGVSTTVTGGTGPYTYLWTNTSAAANLSAVLPGPYCVTVSDAVNCTVNACDTVGFTNAINELATLGMSLYPNPANTVFIVTKQDDAPCELAILTPDGRLITEKLFTTRRQEISTADIPAGVYICRVKNTALGKATQHKLCITH